MIQPQVPLRLPCYDFIPITSITLGRRIHYWSIYPIHLPAHKWVDQRILLRKEVIQPLVPQRLPCYDFIPVISHTFGAFPP